jgi:hypothetical protein
MQQQQYGMQTTPTSNVNYEDASFLVLMFRCVRASHASHRQLNCEWKVQCGDQKPLHIKLHIEKSVAWATRIRITCNEEVLLPKTGAGGQSGQGSRTQNTHQQGYNQQGGYARAQQLARLMEDFRHLWPFRGVVKGIGVPGFVEVRVFHQGVERWFPATIKNHNANDSFDVVVQKHNAATNTMAEESSTVHKVDMRESSTRRPFERATRNLVLLVPAGNPLLGTHLSIDEGKRVTQHFARPTPPPKLARNTPKIVITVTQDRMHASANAGHQQLLNHMSHQVKIVRHDMQRAGVFVGYGSRTWIIQIRHAEHTIRVERKSMYTKSITLIVDGEVLVEACPEDIDCHRGHGMWECSFRFFGEKALEFDMFETAVDGSPMNTKCRVPQKHSISHLCVLSIKSFSDMTKSTLAVDGIDSRQLPMMTQAPATEHNISTALVVMEAQYDVVVPFKVNQSTANNGAMGIIGGLMHGKMPHLSVDTSGVHMHNNNDWSQSRTNSPMGSAYGNNYNNSGYLQQNQIQSSYGYGQHHAPSMFERVIMCMCSKVDYDEGLSADSEFPPLLQWDTNSLLEPTGQRNSQDQYALGWDAVTGKPNSPSSLSGSMSPLSPLSKAKAKAKGKAKSGASGYDESLLWDTDMQSAGKPGSPKRPGEALSAADLRAMGLSEEEIRTQLGPNATQNRSQQGSATKAGVAQKSGAGGLGGQRNSMDQLSVSELRAMGLTDEEIRATQANQQSQQNPAGQLSATDLRAMGFSEEEIRAQTGSTSTTARPGVGASGIQNKGPGQGKGKGKGKTSAQPGQPGSLSQGQDPLGQSSYSAGTSNPAYGSQYQQGSAGNASPPPTGTGPRSNPMSNPLGNSGYGGYS